MACFCKVSFLFFQREDGYVVQIIYHGGTEFTEFLLSEAAFSVFSVSLCFKIGPSSLQGDYQRGRGLI